MKAVKNREKILELFFLYPTKGFHMREISRITKISYPSVRKHLLELEKKKIITRKKGIQFDTFVAADSELFRIMKRNYLLLKLYTTGLIEFLERNFSPDAIILFGSAANGYDVEESDIDLFLIANEKKVDLSRFEKRLKRRISLHFSEDLRKLSKELLNNIINGIVLYGYLKVF